MLTESFVAIMALVTAAILNQHLYFVLNAPAGKTGGTAESAAAYVNTLPLGGDAITGDEIKQAATAVGEKSIVSRTGGAPTLAIGMSDVLHRAFGGPALQAFWYHFAIMFEALFILTTVDAGTRVARFMLSDALGNLGGPLRKFSNPSWRPGAWLCSIIVVALWGSVLLMGVTDPLGGINTLFPLFGIANQLLAAIALTVVTVVVLKKGLLKWAWIPGVPLLWDLVVTLTASWQKIFSHDTAVGYWALHSQCQQVLASGGTTCSTAKNAAAVHAVVRNTFIQGTLSILFAVMVVIVFALGVVMALRVIRGGGTPLTEDDPVPSKIFGPSGLITTANEREVQRQWDEYYRSLPKSPAKSVGTAAP
jgi:carbon starvation protein